MSGEREVRLEGVAKFYGDVLGVNRLDAAFAPGVSGLVGPNGAGKSTLLHLIAGLTRPSRGRVVVRGVAPGDYESLYRQVGYCPQHDGLPEALTGRRFLVGYLGVRGFSAGQALRLADRAIERSGLGDAAERRMGTYSKGMRQRVKLAWAIAHEPRVLLLDEPLSGLDPQARAEAIALFADFGAAGANVLISSHILHEVHAICDSVTFLRQGRIVAEGDLTGLEEDLTRAATPLLIRGRPAADIAAALFARGFAVEARLLGDGDALLARVADADAFFLAFNELVVAEGWRIEAIGPADETVQAAYRRWVEEDAP